MEGLFWGAFAFTVVLGITACYFGFIWWLDRFDKEPFWLLLVTFGWGMVPAIILSVIGEVVFGIPAGVALTTRASELFGVMVFAPFFEELFKALALFGVFAFWRKHFDGPLDGVIYGSIVGLGFALTEDVLYATGALASGPGEMATLIFFRSGVFGMNHAFFTAFTGLGLGLGRMTRKGSIVFILSAGGLLGAMGAHFLHNSLVSLLGGAGLLLSWGVHWTGGVALLVLIFVLLGFQHSLIKRKLSEEVAEGHITPWHYRTGTRWFGIGSELAALWHYGFGAYWRLKALRHDLASLALKRNHLKREKRPEFRHEVGRLRVKVQSFRYG